MLPEGFYDLLYEQVEREQIIEQKLLDIFKTFGYQRIAPSIIEYENSLFNHNSKKDNSGHSFRVVDAKTQRMMAIRCDITKQVARIASGILKKNQRPLRLAYAETSLRAHTTPAKPHRQFSQIGCEIFGANSNLADAEIINIAANALLACRVDKPIVEITIPNIIQLLEANQKLNPQQKKYFENILTRRSKYDLEKLDDKNMIDACQTLLACRGEARATLEKLNDRSRKQPILKMLVPIYQRLEKTLNLLKIHDSITINIDPIETRGFSYHNTFAFTLLSSNARSALGRGGLYRSPFDKEDAIGCSFYLDALAEVVGSNKPNPKIYAQYNANPDEIHKYRLKGNTVVQALDKQTAIQAKASAIKNNCQAIISKNSISKIKNITTLNNKHE